MKDKVLLHCCCAPCSSAILEEYSEVFDITLYFCNPCITNKDEYDLRAKEVKRLVKEMGVNVDVVIADYTPQIFYSDTHYMEEIPEGGKRCKVCYSQRLYMTAQYAKEKGFEYFSTTLTISPYKNSAVINDIGGNIGRSNDVMYMPFDFSYLYKRSLELSKQYNLYQQNYCGCEYSKKDTNS